MTLLSGDFSISHNDVFDDILSCLNTDDLELVPCVTPASVASGKENRCQNQFNQMNCSKYYLQCSTIYGSTKHHKL